MAEVTSETGSRPASTGPPRSPRRWKRWAFLGLLSVFLAFAGSALALRIYFAHNSARWQRWWLEEIGSLDPADYAPPPVPDDQNAALRLRAAGELLTAQSGTTRSWLRTLASKPAAAWRSEERSRFRDYLESQAELRSQLDRLESMSRSSLSLDYADPELSRSVTAENLMTLWRGVRFAAAAGRWALAEGDCELAVRWLTRLERGANVLAEPVVVTQLLAIGVSGDYFDVLRDAVEECPRAEIVAELAVTTERLLTRSASLGDALAREGASIWNLPSPPSRSERILGKNALGGRSGPLQVYGALVLAARGSDERLIALEQRGRRVGVTTAMATILVPNLRDAIARQRSSVTAMRLARRALEARAVGLATGSYRAALTGEPARSAVVDEELSASLEDDGRLELAFELSRQRLAAETPASAPPPHWWERMEWSLPALD